jgi:hypothetical protein
VQLLLLSILFLLCLGDTCTLPRKSWVGGQGREAKEDRSTPPSASCLDMHATSCLIRVFREFKRAGCLRGSNLPSTKGASFARSLASQGSSVQPHRTWSFDSSASSKPHLEAGRQPRPGRLIKGNKRQHTVLARAQSPSLRCAAEIRSSPHPLCSVNWGHYAKEKDKKDEDCLEVTGAMEIRPVSL